MSDKMIEFRIKRQNRPGETPFWDEFSIPYQANMNVISCLQYIVRNPMNKKGEKIPPVFWESCCLEEVCGSCTMNINGRVRQACSALIDDLTQPVTLEPMTKFPVVRDLVVNRSRMFDELKKVKAWIILDGSFNKGPAPKLAQEDQEYAYPISRCMTCGCCVDVCPQYNDKIDFVGAHAIAQVDMHNMHSIGRLQKGVRLEAMMKSDGISACGNAQNCVQVCPKQIPLTTSIGKIGRETTVYAVSRWLKR